MSEQQPKPIDTAQAPKLEKPSIASPHPAGDWQKRVPTSIATPTIVGLLIAGLFFGGFGYWAATVPISGAAVASGVVAASGLNQKVEHLEGGLISNILVAEGDRVNKDQPLIELDQTTVRAERDRLIISLLGLKAREERAIAEVEGVKELVFTQATQDLIKNDSDTNMLTQQIREFQSRYDRYQSELAVLEQRTVASLDEIKGLEIQRDSEISKLEVIREELQQKKALLDKGLTPRSQYNALQRAEADSNGRLGSLNATIAQRKTSILEIKQQAKSIGANRKETASKEVNELRRQISDQSELLRAREEILKRVIIRAPTNGVVVKLLKNTVGSVIRPGEPILEILPTGTDLLIEVRVSPQDIDVVRVGLDANVRFSALNTRTTPEVSAKVSYVSADRLIDNDTRVYYYLARLQLAETLPEEITRDQIFAGMPVDTFIKTGERTFFQYLIRPISDSFSKAFREE